MKGAGVIAFQAFTMARWGAGIGFRCGPTPRVASHNAVSSARGYGLPGRSLTVLYVQWICHTWSASNKQPLGFVASRFAPLYPTFWTCVTLTAAVLWLGGQLGGPTAAPLFAANLTMVPGLLGAACIYGVYWTLFVATKFYRLVLLALRSSVCGIGPCTLFARRAVDAAGSCGLWTAKPRLTPVVACRS